MWESSINSRASLGAAVQLIKQLAQESLDFGVEYIETKRAIRTAT
jgi:hypothetical protein